MESSYNIHHIGHLGPMGNPYTRCRSNRSVAFSPAYKRKNASIWLHNVNRRFREKVPLEQWKNISLYSIKCINETFYRKKIQKIHDFRTHLHTGHNCGKYRRKTQYIYTITYGFACSDMLSCVLLLMRVKQITITTVQGASIKQCNSRSIWIVYLGLLEILLKSIKMGVNKSGRGSK